MKRVLVIEDNALNRELVTDLLEADGYEVFGTETAEQGLEWAEALQPHVILMDIALPHLDGLNALRYLKANPLTRDIPVAVLSAHAMQADQRAAKAAGCAAYLCKPICTRSFLATVAALQTNESANLERKAA